MHRFAVEIVDCNYYTQAYYRVPYCTVIYRKIKYSINKFENEEDLFPWLKIKNDIKKIKKIVKGIKGIKLKNMQQTIKVRNAQKIFNIKKKLVSLKKVGRNVINAIKTDKPDKQNSGWPLRK